MTNNNFCIYQNDYNNTELGDKMYHLTDSSFFFVLKRMLFVKKHLFHLTHNLFLYKNVDLVHIYVTFLHTDISSSQIIYSYKDVSQTYIHVTFLH